ncbi:DnaA-like protein [uncultured Mediterranean phage uvMED]|nr:DnaA-like protein [uncultured Mediterranean phage uvMED]
MKIKEIRQLVERELELDLSHPSRLRARVYARAVYFKLCREHTVCSLNDIGLSVGRDHATVLHGIKIFDDVIVEYEINLYEVYDKLNKLIAKYTKTRERDINPEKYYRDKYADLLVEHRTLLNEYRTLKTKEYV